MKPAAPNADEQRYGQLVLQFIRDLGYDPGHVSEVTINPLTVTVRLPPRPDDPFLRTEAIQIDTREKVAA